MQTHRLSWAAVVVVLFNACNCWTFNVSSAHSLRRRMMNYLQRTETRTVPSLQVYIVIH